jgi:hypothetical protein
MSRGGFAGRRVVFLIALSAALVFVFVAGAAGGAASTWKSSPLAGHKVSSRTVRHISRVTRGRSMHGPSLICNVRRRGNCTTIGCNSASRTIDGTIIHAYWCWNAGAELTSLTWTNTQENPWPENPGYCPAGFRGSVKQSAYLYQFNANETLTSWWHPSGQPNCGQLDTCWTWFGLKATVWGPPNPGIGVTQTSLNAGCYLF